MREAAAARLGDHAAPAASGMPIAPRPPARPTAAADVRMTRPAPAAHTCLRDSMEPMSINDGSRAEPAEPTHVDAVGLGSIDAMRFRSVLGRFATGVVAVTAIDPATGAPTGLAANSFTSVSLDPPLVAFCVAHTSATWPKVRAADRHCINILAEHQREICLQLATKGGDKFAGLTWTKSPGGHPVLDGAVAWLECSPEAEHEAGDHVIVVCRVHHLDKHHAGGPLLFYRGSYGRFQD
jgi:3-hydroxy-9,10-secoandrosta-1,3,5(10)-triene-9,17-dione monooxygenase reductase component